MLQAKPKVLDEVEDHSHLKTAVHCLSVELPASEVLAQNITGVRLSPPRKPNQPEFPAGKFETRADSQMRVPVIIGEVSFRGTIPVDGIVCGIPGANGGSLTVKQRGRTFFGPDPELNGDLSFRDMLRVNGHIAGNVCSKKGTLIVDAAAQIDANIDVSVAVIGGIVNGDIVAHQRVELGAAAKIHGNIWTRSLSIQNGAIFDGVCQMIEGKEDAS
ncbi:MAG TPA: polymer-forming cytoskeletal protein [Pyrinomonadaceae bacterium]|nr:polymer-forming cytoskeletal protein [Pyrinomonadaceae bacterium]